VICPNGRAGFLCAILVASVNLTLAQTPTVLDAPGQSSYGTPTQPGYTLKANSRVVLTDVTVKDAKGDPVRGLPQSAFHIFDRKQPEPIGSFEEHSGNLAQPASTPVAAKAGVYSNDYLQHLPAVLNVIVLDTTNLEIPDQMYLNIQLKKFIEKLSDNQQLAVYLRGGDRAFLLQDFTSDRSLLADALRKALPRFPPHGRQYISDLSTLHQLAVYLAQLPGRKNIIWFTGGSTLYLRADGELVENNADWRRLYDELERERIAVYPIDARGLTTNSGFAMIAQHAVMEDVAHATGGHAFYNTNAMVEAAKRVLDTEESFYTLTYSPRNFRFDNKWHSVRVTVDGGPYQLSYRSGYFADSGGGPPEPPAKSRTLITAGGERAEVSPQLMSVPVIFEASVLPASQSASPTVPDHSVVGAAVPPRRGEVTYTVHYMVPADALTVQDAEGNKRVNFGIAALAFNRDGRAIVHKAEAVTMTLNEQALREHPHGRFAVNQQINLQKGDEYLYLAVWDKASGRLGTLQIALDVSKPVK
jgi:VWFA-related protein